MDRVNQSQRGWRLAVRHATTSRYAGEVFASYNEARLTPARTGNQVVIESHVEVTPAAVVNRYRDYWGTVVHTFGVHVPHTELTVVGSAVVDTSQPTPTTNASWDDLADPARADEFYEFLAASGAVTADDALASLAIDILANAPTPRVAVGQVIDCVRERMVYERGHTTITTSAAEAWQQGSGVCQDFAHATLALLRSMGIPGRYVSGYLHPDHDARTGDVVTAESHAWIEAWLGDWAAFDPTNGDPVGHRHVVVARGREYNDVAPTRGVYTGAAAAGQDVTVQVTRLS
jgi:transglutaminase-like putative cysteine protease